MSPLAELLSARYDTRRCTIISTNLLKDEIKTMYGDRIFDRMGEMYNYLFYDGEQQSYRGLYTTKTE